MKFCTSCKLIQPINWEHVVCTYCSGTLKEISEEERDRMIKERTIKYGADEEIKQDEETYECSYCGKEVTGNLEECPHCNHEFEDYISAETSDTKNIKYPALEWIVDILNIFAYIYLIGGIIIAIILFVSFQIILAIISIVVGTFLWLFTKAGAEILKIQIDIETNTRNVYELIKNKIDKKD